MKITPRIAGRFSALHPPLAALLLPLLLTGCGGGSNSPAPLPDQPPPAEPPPVEPPPREDPLYGEQWHLRNSGQSPGLLVGEDINVASAWEGGAKGSGVLLVVVDDGLEIGHEDLQANVAPGKSWDYNQNDTNPTPPLLSSSNHGTMVAGVAAARDLNGLGGRGVAPRVSLAGYNLLASGFASTAHLWNAMTGNGNVAEVDVSNNSWGFDSDGTGVPVMPDTTWQDAVAYGTTYGRDGRGTLYLWAGGNGGEGGIDNSNYDFQANNRHVMAVCAVDGDGAKAPYSEEGANLWLCAPGGYDNGITTTDLMGNRGGNYSGITGDYSDRDYTRRFAGTSAATPVVSGVVALMLGANPSLGWRDVRLILAETARKNDAGDGGWSVTAPASGQPQYHINHKYGFGVVDAAAAVARANGWVNVGAQVMDERLVSAPLVIPDNLPAGIEQPVNIDTSSGLIIEYVEVEVRIVHGNPGDLRIVLTAPSGTESVLAHSRPCPFCQENDYNPWTFGSSRHLGEGSAGRWTLRIADPQAGNNGSLISWTLRIYGRQP